MKKQIIAWMLILASCISGCAAQPAEGNDPSDISSQPSEPQTEQVVIDPLAQEAVMQTALAYLARGTRVQYDDSRLTDSPPGKPVLYRWQSCVRQSPEEYTAQNTGYTNCAAFVGEVYLAALGIDLGTQTTGGLIGITDKRRVFNYKPTGKETESEKIALEEQFRATLEVGDVIVIRYNGAKAGQGHAMLYVDSQVLAKVDGYKGAAAEGTDENGVPNDDGYVYDIIHSTGSSYKYTTGTEKYEQYGSIQKTSVDSLFDHNNARYVFGKLMSIAVVRPLVTFQGTVPQHTLNRMEKMENVIAEKLSTHGPGYTVSPGQIISFTFAITNKNDHEVTLEVADAIPANTTLFSAEDCTMNGTALTWEVTVPAGETREVSYRVKVNEDAPVGGVIHSKEGTVGGIAVNCAQVYIGRTLQENEQKAVLTAINKLSGSKKQDLALANAVYAEAMGIDSLLPEAYDVLEAGLYIKENDCRHLAADGAYQNMVVPGLFGGTLLIQRTSADEDVLAKYEDQRTRLLTKAQLIAGDIIVADTDLMCTNQVFYMYNGQTLFDLHSGELLSQADSERILTECLRYSRFVVLRPSLAMAGNQ